MYKNFILPKLVGKRVFVIAFADTLKWELITKFNIKPDLLYDNKTRQSDIYYKIMVQNNEKKYVIMFGLKIDLIQTKL